MKSITKRELSEMQIEQMITAAFGNRVKAKAIHELTDGYFNISYRIELTDKSEAILKVAPNPAVKVLTYEKGLMQVEVAVLKSFSLLDIPVPEVLFYDDTLSVIDSEYFFMTYLDGIPLNKVKDKLTEAQYQLLSHRLGVYMNSSKNINKGYFGEICNGQKQYDNWFDCFRMMISDLMDDANQIKMELPLSKLEAINLVEKNKEALSQITKPLLVHKDLWEGNIFVDSDTFDLIGIIDCERAIYADPLMEIVCGFFEGNKEFINSYYGTFEFSQQEQIRIMLYRFYLFLLMVVECPYREYEDQNQIKWVNKMLKSSITDLINY